MDIVDLARLSGEDVWRLLLPAFGSVASARRALERFQAGEWNLLASAEAGSVVGLVGFEVVSDAQIRIRAISVDAGRRRHGIGASLIREVRRRFPLAAVSAETDGESVGFYERCGFQIVSLGETFPGVERFECTLLAGRER